MKRFFSQLKRVLTLSVILILFLAGCNGGKTEDDNGNAGSDVILKIGVVSDIHIPHSAGQQHFKNALEYYKEQGVGVIMFGGDLVDAPRQQLYTTFTGIFNEVFPENAPKTVYAMGNHDFMDYSIGWIDQPDAEELFKQNLNQDPDIHIVVNGFHFIGISPDTGLLDYSAKKLWLKRAIANAIKNDPNKPIFVIGHAPAVNTVHGSQGGSNDLYNIFKDYPQIIYFSGHSHYPILDERSIYQEHFTAINAGSLAYTDTEPNIEDRPSTAGQSFSFGFLIEVKNNSVEIKRINFEKKKQEKNSWIIKYPVNKEDFIYTSGREEKAVAPVFKERANISASDVTSTGFKLTFDAASHEDMVYLYRVTLTAESGETIVKKYFSDFYLSVESMSLTKTVQITGLQSKTKYQVKVEAMESFGKYSENFLSISVTTN